MNQAILLPSGTRFRSGSKRLPCFMRKTRIQVSRMRFPVRRSHAQPGSALMNLPTAKGMEALARGKALCGYGVERKIRAFFMITM